MTAMQYIALRYLAMQYIALYIARVILKILHIALQKIFEKNIALQHCKSPNHPL
jgi:hypothetical protein